jgi:hypothetical protein
MRYSEKDSQVAETVLCMRYEDRGLLLESRDCTGLDQEEETPSGQAMDSNTLDFSANGLTIQRKSGSHSAEAGLPSNWKSKIPPSTNRHRGNAPSANYLSLSHKAAEKTDPYVYEWLPDAETLDWSNYFLPERTISFTSSSSPHGSTIILIMRHYLTSGDCL